MPLWLLKNPLASILGAILAVSLVANVVQWFDSKASAAAADARQARAEKAHAEAISDINERAAAAMRVVLEKQQRLQRDADESRKELTNAQARIGEQDARIATLRTSASRLRGQLASYAAAANDPDSSTTCAARAAALADYAARGGELLERCSSLSRRAAVGEAQRAAEVRALIAAWPKTE